LSTTVNHHPEFHQPCDAKQGGAIAQATITGEKVKGWSNNILLALSISANIALLFMYRYDAQERDLDRYDDGQFISHDFANLKNEVSELKSQISTEKELIQAYGLQKAVKDAAKER
jgi:hypothetical protein